MSECARPASTPLWRHPAFAEGARDMTGIAFGVAAWGLVTGMAMAKSGMDIGLAVLMSLTVFAGSAQLATVPLIVAAAPLWVIWGAAFCVNLRFIILSAGWRPYMVGYSARRRWLLSYFTADLNYVIFMRRFPQPVPHPDQWPYFWGGALTNWLAWQVPSLAGIFLAEAIPASWGVGVAGSLALLGLTFSLLTDRATWVAAAVAACASIAAYALPLKLNIVVAIAAAVAAGLMMDRLVPAAGRSGARGGTA